MENEYNEFLVSGLVILSLIGGLILTMITKRQREKIRKLEKEREWKQQQSTGSW